MTQVQEEKWLFVSGCLAPLIMRIDPSVEQVWYSVTDTGKESVTVQWSAIHSRCINVTGDSLHALALDVLSKI